MARKTTEWKIQTINCEDGMKDDLDIAKNRKPQNNFLFL